MARREPMSSVDRSWLLMDRPTNRMVINGFWLFEEPVAYEQVLATLERRLLIHDRFRQRAVEPKGISGRAYWEFDPNFDVRAHVRHIALPAPGDKAALQELMAELIADPLDRSRPLWMFYLIDNYAGGNVIFGRIHHSIGDGAALVHVLLSLADPTAEDSWDAEAVKRKRRRTGLLGGLAKRTLGAASTAFGLGETLLSEGLRTLARPSHLLDLLAEGGSLAGQTAQVLAKLALMTADDKTVFKGELGVAKRVAWSEPIPLDDVKLVKNVMGATVNDVLAAALAGGLRRYMLRRGDRPEGKEVRAMVPVNVRGQEAPVDLGNKFALVYLDLPVGIADPLDRLFEVKRRMDHIKASPEPLITYQIIAGLGRAPGEMASLIIEYFASKASAVLTNVPGPREKLYFAGKRFDTMVFWVPQSGSIGMGLSIYSYGGEVTIGVITDEGLVPDPDGIVQGFVDEFSELLALARLPEDEATRARRERARARAAAVQEIPIAREGRADETPESLAEDLLRQFDALKQAAAVQEASDQASPAQVEPGQCQALTKAGRPCRKRARPGSKYCHIHARS